MKNRLKETFSQDALKTSIKLQFIDQSRYDAFIAQLETVHETGEVERIEGVAHVSADILVGSERYSIHEPSAVTSLAVGPSHEYAPIAVETDEGPYTWPFIRTQLKDKVLLQNKETSIMHIFLTIDTISEKIELKMTPNVHEAKEIAEIARIYIATVAFMRIFDSSNNVHLSEIMHDMEACSLFWRRVVEIEKHLNIKFLPSEITINTEERRELDELYLSLVERMPIQSNRKITSFFLPDSETQSNEALEIGKQFAVTFLSQDEFAFGGVVFSIFTVNVVCNMLVDAKSRLPDKDGTQIELREVDSTPGFITYKAFKSQEEQLEEQKRLTSNFNEYINEYREAKDFYNIWKEKFK